MDNAPHLLEILSTVPGWLAVVYLLIREGGSALRSRLHPPKSDSGKIERIADERLRRAGLPTPSPTPTESQRLAALEAWRERVDQDKRDQTYSLQALRDVLREIKEEARKDNLPNANRKRP